MKIVIVYSPSCTNLLDFFSKDTKEGIVKISKCFFFLFFMGSSVVWTRTLFKIFFSSTEERNSHRFWLERHESEQMALNCNLWVNCYFNLNEECNMRKTKKVRCSFIGSQSRVQVYLCPQHVSVNMSVRLWMKYAYGQAAAFQSASSADSKPLTLSLHLLCLSLWCVWFLWLLTHPYYCLSIALRICCTFSKVFSFFTFDTKPLWHATTLKDHTELKACEKKYYC